MDKEELLKAAEELESFSDWARGSTRIGVTLSADEYYFDLGTFGDGYTYVELEDDDYSIDLYEILSRSDLGPDEFAEIAALIRTAAETPETREETLDDVLARMVSTGSADEQWLARILTGVADVLRGFPTTAGAPLAATPAPWPGALRDDIDYTAEDFPFRYLPPPGFVWRDRHGGNTRNPAEAASQEATAISGAGMVLDNKGRVRYYEPADGDYSSGIRWRVWHDQWDDIPAARGFSSDPPRAIDRYGEIIEEPHTAGTEYAEWHYNWRDEDAADLVGELLRARESAAPADVEEPAEEFAAPAPVSI